ncbi:cyclin-T1-3-like isoform X2 [Cucurbita maxima]|nr:cyclin-T1-3-like isoform X2 [Cucurbita maxima]XP_022970822.1 cyclin-T1-3-like isoform X2 [Cucurbita maxima]
MHMENLSSTEPSHQAIYENSDSKQSQDGLEDGSRWYFSRKELEEYSPSRQDGIDLKKETYLRKSYCTFLQDLGMRLKVIDGIDNVNPNLREILLPVCFSLSLATIYYSIISNYYSIHCDLCIYYAVNYLSYYAVHCDVLYLLCSPQVTIATAIIFCHRFFLRQSHAKNDRRTIATVCMFLAGKVEETPRPLKDVIMVSYEIINKKDPTAAQKIRQKEVYERQKELILLGERVVLATLGFDLNVHHPYKPLVEAIKKFKVAQNALAQVAWNFVNDGLRTSLCLQFKPHHIAAGAVFLAAKFLKVKLPSDGEKVWWQEFDVTPRQLEEVSNQMLELYEQNRLPPSGEADGNIGSGPTNLPTTKAPTNSEEQAVTDNRALGVGIATSRLGTSKAGSSRPASEHSFAGDQPSRAMQNHSVESSNVNFRSPSNHKTGSESRVRQEMEPSAFHDKGKAQNSTRLMSEGLDEQDRSIGSSNVDFGNDMKINETRDAMELKDKHVIRNIEFREGTFGKPQEAIKIDKDKVKAALEKRRKSLGSMTQKKELVDEDDLIERELEAGVEMAAGSEKNKREQRQSWNKSSNEQEPEDSYQDKHREDDRDEHPQRMRQQPLYNIDSSNMEEGEFADANEVGYGYQESPKSNNSRKRGRELTG